MDAETINQKKQSHAQKVKKILMEKNSRCFSSQLISHKFSSLDKDEHLKQGIFYTVPDQKTYANRAWKWDLVFGSITAHQLYQFIREPKLQSIAKGSILAALRHQITEEEDKGMVPHMSFEGGQDQILWKNMNHSSITQPPIIAIGVYLLKDKEFTKMVYSCLKAEIQWWLNKRMKNELPYIVHPWESGRDASRDHDSQIIPYFTKETPQNLKLQTINPSKKDQRILNTRFNILLELQDNKTFQTHQKYFHQSPDMTAFLVKSLQCLQEMSLEMGLQEDHKFYQQNRIKMTHQCNQIMWSQDDNFYYSIGNIPDKQLVEKVCQNFDFDKKFFQVDSSNRIKVRTANAFLILYAGIANQTQAKKLFQVLESEQFNTFWPVPTVSSKDIGYSPEEYWRGSTWININYFIVLGLVRYMKVFKQSGDEETLAKFKRKALSLIDKTIQLSEKGFYQFYSSCQNCQSVCQGPKQFTWSTLSFPLLQLKQQLLKNF